jgi:capsular polysaccharide biosynthesis protein
MYEASLRILVGQEQGGSTPGNLGSGVQDLKRLTNTMSEATKNLSVAEFAVRQHNLQITPEELLEDRLSIEQIQATQLIEVKYRDSDPKRAQQVANTIGDVVSEQVSEMSPSAYHVTATVWDRAEVPAEPASPNLVLDVGVALIVGLVLGVPLAFRLEYSNDRWRSPEEVEQILEMPTTLQKNHYRARR